ncbi:MAG: FAD-dependent oxidoreductase [Ginsengibacter sp.]
MFSYWEKESFLHYHHVVVGAGITGLSTAIELKENDPEKSVLVLERGFFTTGASSKNAGFACMGSVSELAEDLKTMKHEDVFKLFEWRKRGLEKLRSRLGDKNIGYEENGSYEIINENEIESLDKVDFLNQMLRPITGKDPFELSNKNASDFGFNKNNVKHIIENKCEGELHTGKMMRALTDKAIQCGVEIKTGAEVLGFDDVGNEVVVKIKIPFSDEIIELRSATLVISTNSFTKTLLPDEDIQPGRGQVLITHPIAKLPFKGIFHFDKGYYYFREIDGRVLFGGGRNLDFDGETTTTFGISESIQNMLEKKLKEIILPEIDFSIDQRWSGIMAFGKDKFPIVKALSGRVFGAFRLGGMGVALGSEIAGQVASLVWEEGH